MPGEISRSYSGPNRIAGPSPRPWHYQEGADAYTHIVRTAENGFVCQLRQDPYGGAEVDARLIAAAPSMEDALISIAEIAEGSGTANSLPHIAKIARAALSSHNREQKT